MTGNPRLPDDPDAEEADAAVPDGTGAEEEDTTLPENAFYSPDDPIARSEGEIPADAIFSPDDPLTRSEDEEGEVTGIGGSSVRPPQTGRDLVWELRYTADLLKALQRDLREHGMEALRIHPDTEAMDAMLRSFIAGYLVGRMEGEE